MKDKNYTLEQEQIARFAKAMGHPASVLPSKAVRILTLISIVYDVHN